MVGDETCFIETKDGSPIFSSHVSATRNSVLLAHPFAPSPASIQTKEHALEPSRQALHKEMLFVEVERKTHVSAGQNELAAQIGLAGLKSDLLGSPHAAHKAFTTASQCPQRQSLVQTAGFG